jgi:molybdopterin molybdotransferase
MFTAAEAERIIFTLVRPIQSIETVDLNAVSDCLGRVLAAATLSPLDFPHWDNSAMDGYAVRVSDLQQVPVTLQIVEEIPAGKLPQKALQPGQAARILTGAMLPEGADAVVMQEETERTGEHVTILKAAELQAFVRQRGSFARVGDELLAAGRVIGPAEMALLAAAQQTQIPVFRRPRVAILSTGSELVRPNQALQPGQLVDSNQYALAALVAQTGAVPVPLGIVGDDRAQLKAAIASALAQADLVISSGGVSVGDYDYVEEVLEELGATLHIRAVAVKPGKPLTVASFDYAQPSGEFDYAQASGGFEGEQISSGLDGAQSFAGKSFAGKVYFGLPGNPASAMVGFWRFVAPAIAKLSGRVSIGEATPSQPWSPEFVWAKATMALTAGGDRETYLWGKLVTGEAGYEFERASGGHSSGNLVNLVATSGLGVVPQGETRIEAGQALRVLKIRS